MKRSILLEVNHPGQVHLFRYVYSELIKRGNHIIVVTKENKSIEYLLNAFTIPYLIIGRKSDRLWQKAILQITHNIKAFKIVKKNNIEIGIGSSITNDHVSFFTRMRSIHFSDDDEAVVPFISKYSYPFSNLILSPDCIKMHKHEKKTLRYAGYHELAYLHPKRFKPDLSIIERVGLKASSKYFILRFVALKGHHDHGELGISLAQKIRLIALLSKYGNVYITSEKEIEPEIEKYRMPIKPEEIHSFIYYSSLFVGDSQTMTSEAAVLGVPAFRCNTFVGRISYLDEEENKYSLTYGFLPKDFEKMYSKIESTLKIGNIKEEWNRRRDRMLNDKIDVTAFMVWFIENYPESKKIMKENPDYQYNFK